MNNDKTLKRIIKKHEREKNVQLSKHEHKMNDQLAKAVIRERLKMEEELQKKIDYYNFALETALKVIKDKDERIKEIISISENKLREKLETK